MKTTVDLPDELLAAVQEEAARRSLKIDDLVAELVRRGLTHPDSTPAQRPMSPDAASDWLTEYQAIGKRIYEKSVDDRTLVEILIQDRR